MSAQTLFDYLERLSSLMRIWNRQHPQVGDLQPIQLSALYYLSRCNRYSNTPLGVADYLGLTKGTVSQSLKALESKGLIIKRQDAHDKRSVHLELSEEARQLLAKLVPPDFLTHAVEEMGAERQEALVHMLDQLLRTIQRQQDVPGFGLCKTCRFHQQKEGLPFCGLTKEPLEKKAIQLICREHQFPQRTQGE